MPTYKVLYLKDDALIEKFRNQIPHEGPVSLGPNNYEQVAEVEAPNEYAVWQLLRGEGARERNIRDMVVGDALEIEGGKPRVCKFSGFDDAVWFTFEPKKKEGEALPTEAPSAPSENGQP